MTIYKYDWYKQKNTWNKWYIETTVDNDGILRLDVKLEGLDHKNLWEITTKYHCDHRKHTYELVEEPKKQCNSIFIDK